MLFLHAGDLFQGTLYFTQFQGVADTEFWNLMKLDVATMGNHEFDKGPPVLLANLLQKAAVHDRLCQRRLHHGAASAGP